MFEPRSLSGGAPGDLSEEMLERLSRHLTRAHAALVLRRSASACGIGLEMLERGCPPAFLVRVEQALSLYLEGEPLQDARRGIRALLARRGGLGYASPGGRTAPVAATTTSAPAARAATLRSAAPPPSHRAAVHPPSVSPADAVDLPVAIDAHLEAARQESLRYSRTLGLRHVDSVKVATVVSELARNILQYAGQGRIHLSPTTNAHRGLLLVATDQGPGIHHIEAILQGRYRSRTGMGLGIYGSKKLMDRFEVDTGPDRGTTITAEKHA